MSNFLKRFLEENPQYSLVSALPEEDQKKVLFAREKGYISKTLAPSGEAVFTQKQLEIARMWWEKEGRDA